MWSSAAPARPSPGCALPSCSTTPGLVGDAVAGGERLLATATVTPHGWSWAAPEAPRRRHLCGLSHGAGGIGWALLELYAATGDERFRAGAEGAFAYERSWLDRETGTWPDLRIGGQRRGRRVPSPAIGTWCHGEAGIALTRMRAAELLGPDPYAAEAELALSTTASVLEATLAFDLDDVTLCHGAAGAADVLLCAGTREPPERLGRLALACHDPAGRDWPSGIAAGSTPALFQGLSGIGWWFLRLYDPRDPVAVSVDTRARGGIDSAHRSASVCNQEVPMAQRWRSEEGSKVGQILDALGERGQRGAGRPSSGEEGEAVEQAEAPGDIGVDDVYTFHGFLAQNPVSQPGVPAKLVAAAVPRPGSGAT